MNENTNLVLRDIPDYTKDDYISTSVPYEFLYEYIGNVFLLEQMIELMREQAASVGVKKFMSLWKGFLLSKKEQKQSIENATRFDGQELELSSGFYTCDDYGVRYINQFGFEVCVCDHPIMPVRRLCNVDSGKERLEIAFKKGHEWKKIIVPKSVISSASSILELSDDGVMVNSVNAKELSNYLFKMEQFNYSLIPEQKSVSRLGWVGGHGFAPYVEGLTFDGENSFRGMFNAVQIHGSYDKWLEAMRKMRAEKTIGRLFLAASFASVLLEPCGLLPFFLHSWGGTGNGKTVGNMIAASVWGSPKIGEYITTFNSTGVGQEMTAAFLNSLPMCIDELQIQVASGVKDFDKMIYQLCEGVGKTRGTKTGGLQAQNKWRCCFITNGEQPISNSNSNGGAVNRIIEFECFEKVYSDLVGICDVITENYGFAGEKFIEMFKHDGSVEFVSNLQKEYYQELLKYDSTEKQAASASILLTADAIATEWIFKDDYALTVDDIASLMSKKSEVDINVRAYDYICDLCAMNPNHFKANKFDMYPGEVWGKYEPDCVYIIKSVFDREMSAQGYNPSTFLAWAKRQGYLTCEEGKRTKKSRVNGVLTNCVCLYLGERTPELPDYYGTEGENEG